MFFEGGRHFPLSLSSSGWTKNETDMRQINMRKIKQKVNNIYMGETQENSKLPKSSETLNLNLSFFLRTNEDVGDSSLGFQRGGR